MWLAFDEFENKYLTDKELILCYPRVEYSIPRLIQPPALPVPVPFVSYYYNEELVEVQAAMDADAVLTPRQKKLVFCLDHDFNVFFVAMWMMEASSGRKQYVLHTGTINLLERNVMGLQTIAGYEVYRIFEFMRSTAALPDTTHNWVCFRHLVMEESAFVWATAKTGEYDHTVPSRQCLCISMGKGRIRMQSSAVLPRSSVLDRTMLPTDLEKIKGLREHVHRNQCHREGPLTVGNVLETLMDTVRSNSVREAQPRGMEQYWRANNGASQMMRTQSQVEQPGARISHGNSDPERQHLRAQFEPRSPEYFPAHEPVHIPYPQAEQQHVRGSHHRPFYLDREINRSSNCTAGRTVNRSDEMVDREQREHDISYGVNNLPVVENPQAKATKPMLSLNSCFDRRLYASSASNTDKNFGRSKHNASAEEKSSGRDKEKKRGG